MDETSAEAVGRWLIKAHHDLRTARLALADSPPITDVACYHAQQCAEKAIKAFLVSVDEHVHRSHDLTFLLGCCVRHDGRLNTIVDEAGRLTDYAIATRYPDDWREIAVEEASIAIRDAESIVELVSSIVEHDVTPGPASHT